MTPTTLANRLETLVSSAENEIQSTIKKTQRKIYRDLVSVLKNLELDREGYIRNNTANRRLLSKAETAFDSSIRNSGYKTGVEKFISHFDSVADLNTEYFLAISQAFTPNAQFLRSLQNQAIKQIETMALNEGLVSNVKTPLMSVLNKNVNTGGSFASFLEEVRAYIIGSGSEGKLLRYSRTWTTDALYGFARAYQQSITVDLGLTFYYYAGGAIDKTRDFCRERLDQFWSQKEIESWASLDWGGKNPGTTESSIFIYLGGYNCRHSLIPVSEKIVPKEVIDRNKM